MKTEDFVRYFIGIVLAATGIVRLVNPAYDITKVIDAIFAITLILIGLLFIFPKYVRVIERAIAGEGGKLKYKLSIGPASVEIERKVSEINQRTDSIKEEFSVSTETGNVEISNQLKRVENGKYSPQTSMLIVHNAIDETLKTLALQDFTNSDTIYKTSTKNVSKYLGERKIINPSLGKLIEDYLGLWNTAMYSEYNEVQGAQLIGISKTGVEILRIIKATTFIPKTTYPIGKTSLVSSGSKLIRLEEEVVLRTFLTVRDSRDQVFPVSSILSESNVTVREVCSNGQSQNAKVIAFRRLGMQEIQSTLSVVLVIDTSGSMNDPSGMGRSRIDAVKQASKSLVKKLYSNSYASSIRIAVLPFNERPHKFASIREDNSSGIWMLTERQVLKTINDLKTESKQTALRDAVSEAVKVLSVDSKNVIICLTDGYDNTSLIEASDLIDEVTHSSCPIFAVGYGVEEKHILELAEISEASGAGGVGEGVFHELSPNRLPLVFDNILEIILNEYELVWKSTCNPGSDVDVHVNIKSQEAQVDFRLDYLIE